MKYGEMTAPSRTKVAKNGETQIDQRILVKFPALHSFTTEKGAFV